MRMRTLYVPPMYLYVQKSMGRSKVQIFYVTTFNIPLVTQTRLNEYCTTDVWRWLVFTVLHAVRRCPQDLCVWWREA